MSMHEYEGWAVVEMTGGRECIGRVMMDADPLIRIDVPIARAGGEEIIVTEFWSRCAILSLRPCTEAIARHLAGPCRALAGGGVEPVDDRCLRPTLPDFETATRMMEAAQ
jgi:hypothetical protein